MIIDNINNLHQYLKVNEKIAVGLKYLKETDFSLMKPGRYDIDNENVYALLQIYDTKPVEEGKWEAHRKYIDIQYIVEGCERIGYSNIRHMKEITDYYYQKDFILLEGEGNFITVNSGSFAIFMPQDAHMPCVSADTCSTVKKVVVKVLV
jgi:YhcH/YjgK/YiaL family protein